MKRKLFALLLGATRLIRVGSVLSLAQALALNPAIAQSSADAEIDRLDEIAQLRAEVEDLRKLVQELLGMPVDSNPGDNSGKATSAAESNESSELVKRDTFLQRRPIGRVPDDAFVTAGDFSGSVSIPGSAGSFRIGGMVQVNGNYDWDNQGFQQIGVPTSIPIDGDPDDGEKQFGIHARLSNFNLDYRAPTAMGNFRAFVEFDMFGDGDQFTNDYDVRLRHAGVELGNWRFGQYHSGFIDVFALPESADPGSPLAAPVLRQPGFYYMRGTNDGSNVGLGIENPAFDFAGNADLLLSESLPNVVAFGKLQRDWGYVRLAGLGLQLRSRNEEVLTGGVHLSGRINTPKTGPDDNVSFGVQYGEGFVHYYSSFVGGLDGVISDTGDVEATGIEAAFFSLSTLVVESMALNVYGQRV